VDIAAMAIVVLKVSVPSDDNLTLQLPVTTAYDGI
jgi:hypothetical protein